MIEVFVTGGRGMVGSAILRELERNCASTEAPGRDNLDLLDRVAVTEALKTSYPQWVVIAAAKVGGIHANNTYPAEFIHENLLIETNLIEAAHTVGSRVLFLGSSCIYPRMSEQPMVEEALLTGPLESTNEPYAIAKIAGIKLCESYNRQYGTDYRSVMPTNLYGEGDNFHAEDSHVIPALMRRFHEAKMANADSVQVWGSGNAMREFLYVDDLARACVHVMKLDKAELDSMTKPMCSHINIGTGQDVTIRELAETMVKVIDFKGRLVFDTTKPDGTPRKLLDVSKINALGWRAEVSLEQGLRMTYEWFLKNQETLRN